MPGPGSYKAEEGMDIISSHPVAPAFSLSPPWQPLRPTSARPGPGTYRQASFFKQHPVSPTLTAGLPACWRLLLAHTCCCELLFV